MSAPDNFHLRVEGDKQRPYEEHRPKQRGNEVMPRRKPFRLFQPCQGTDNTVKEYRGENKTCQAGNIQEHEQLRKKDIAENGKP
ncbi:hypothetical protein FACS1894145_3650 [Bacteroidia bacterium]|nr:hypothetical protein FACS1894145_3650 [Bacteroidia bacterium]